MNNEFVNVVEFIKNDFIEASIDTRFKDAVRNSKDYSLFNNRPPRFVTLYSRNDDDNTDYEWIENINKKGTNIIMMKINGNTYSSCDPTSIVDTLIHNTNNEELLSNIHDAFNSIIGEKYELKNTGKISVIPLFKITDDVIQIIIDSEFK